MGPKKQPSKVDLGKKLLGALKGGNSRPVSDADVPARKGPGVGSGATFTVKEENKIKFTRQLNALREGELSKVEFPSNLEIVERKYIHKLSEELGLKSKSFGKGENRYIVVRKKDDIMGDNKIQTELPVFSLQNKSLGLLRKHFTHSLPEKEDISGSSSSSSIGSGGKKPHAAKPLADELDFISRCHANAQAERRNSPDFPEIQRQRNKLSSAQFKDQLCDMVRNNQVCLVSGETGCGKTTQVPQFILDDEDMGPSCRIAVTQPRRISAISVAERMAHERCEPVGKSIAYNIKLESAKSKGSQVVFMTPGVLLRKLHVDGNLDEYSHIIVDEAHERDRFTEFAIMILRDILKRRPSLRLVLMSATMHTAKLSDYFGGIPHLSMGGSMFPVEEFFLEDALTATGYNERGFSSSTNGVGGSGSGGSAFAMPMAAEKRYTCKMCGHGDFRSPQELGTHTATCAIGIGLDETTTTTSSSSTKKKKGSTALGSGVSLRSQPLPSRGNDRKADASSLSALERMVRGISVSTEPVVVRSGIKASTSIFDLDPTAEKLDDAEAEEMADLEMDARLDHFDASATQEVDDIRKNLDEVDRGTAAMLRHYQATRDDSKVDCVLLLELLKYIFKSEYSKDRGSVLVFLPGWQEISEMSDVLAASHEFHNHNKFKVIQLHSQVNKKAQQEAFTRAKKGCYKIILSTNIAETSITIDDVNVVVDSGRMKERTYDPHTKLCYLKAGWVSRSSARQRKGRAGRTSAGVCFHLFSRRRHRDLPDFQDSEILRMPLEELVLQAKVLDLAPGRGDDGDSVQAFLLKAMDPPHTLTIDHSISLLTSIGCLERETERITTLGRTVSHLPLDPRLARTIVLSCLLGCGQSALKAASTMGYRDPFVIGMGEEERARVLKIRLAFSEGFPSDQVVLYKALSGYIDAVKKGGPGRANTFCREKCISYSTMSFLNDFVYQLQHIMEEVGLSLKTNPRFSRNDGNMPLVAGVLGMGMYPDVGVRRNKTKAFLTEKGRKAKIHNSSVVGKLKGYSNKMQDDPGLQAVTFAALVENRLNEERGPGGVTLSMCDCTFFSVFALLLTCGDIEEVMREDDDDEEDEEDEDDNGKKDMVEMKVDGWITLITTRETFALVTNARHVLNEAVNALVADPSASMSKDLETQLDAVIKVMVDEQLAQNRVAYPDTKERR